MVKQLKQTLVKMLVFFAFALCLTQMSIDAYADPPYTRDATLLGAAYPGVYSVIAEPGDQNATIGISSLAKQTRNTPTTESPAIIMGAAVPYEVKTGPTEFTQIEGGALYPPYSYFRYNIINEQGPDGTWHQKMSGFDGSYFIIRVDVSALIQNAPEGSFLHVKQAGNKALMASLLYEKYNVTVAGMGSFSDALGNKTAVYALDNGALALKDGRDVNATPYVDVIVYSSGTLVAGAETGSTDPTVQNADFSLKFYVDQTADYNTGLDYDPNNTSTTTPTHEEQVMAKFFDDSKASTTYTIKGNDLEIEIMNDEHSPREFWSLRKALAWPDYNNSPIKMICEVPVLEGLLVDGNRNVIFDVNSFDIQIANHQSGDAALTVRNATLKIMDSFNTTGAELAVGNNAKMSIEAGGVLIIDETCQLEVEYDAASVAPGQDTPTPALDSGVISIEYGGTIVNNGVISIEGTEGKPIDPAAPAIRDMKAAALYVKAGGTLENNGCLLAYGALNNFGTIINNGRYNDTIISNDPDKGQFAYHKGIQVAWKDDVTQQGVYMGRLNNGDEQNAGASLVNNGDIVLTPGFLENYGSMENTADGNIYLCEVVEAVIPTQVPWQVLIVEERIGFERPVAVYFTNHPGAVFSNAGEIASAQVELVGNGRTGALTAPIEGGIFCEISLDNMGQMINSGSILLDGVYSFGPIQNSGPVECRVVLEANAQGEGSLRDTAGLSYVYNAARTEDGGANVWTRVGCSELSVSPTVQYGIGGDTKTWTVNANTAQPDAAGVRYLLAAYQGNESTPVMTYTITANEEQTLSSPTLPYMNGNALYRFHLLDGLDSVYAEATVKVTSVYVTPPAAITGLVYNGKDQNLVTAGGASDGTMQYRLGETGEWSDKVPTGKNAGSYKVYYRLQGDTGTEYVSVDASIAKKPVTVSGNDAVSQVGAALAELSWTVSGLAEGETTLGDGVQISATTDANVNTVGTYKVTVTVAGENPNYAITAQEGKYTVSNEAFAVVAKDKYGVFSDEATYKGFNIELTVPEGTTAYYSTAVELTAENYQTVGMTVLKNLPATAGTHTVYYYVTNGVSSVSGSKRVIIDKAQQTAPDSTKLLTRAESYHNSGDGTIEGLTPRKMEYRDKGNDGSYALAYYEKVYVMPGTYLVRMVGDDNHYPSPDTELTVPEGERFSVSFDCNGSTSVIAEVTGLSCGDQFPRPAVDPTLPDATFLGWFRGGKPYDFDNCLVSMPITLTAGWAPNAIEFKLPASLTEIGQNAFEGGVMKSVEIPLSCTDIYPNAFKNCANLKQIRILNPNIRIYTDAFDGCSGLYVFAPADAYNLEQNFCTEDSGFIFVADVN